MKRLKRTTESFIIEANGIHNNKYDYSNAVYTRIDHKVKIVCSKHGMFEQTPHTHLIYKSGCPECFQDRNGDTTETFIAKAQRIHGGKYNYSNVEYKNNSTKVEIVCAEHGVFEQLPGNHISRESGCPKCAYIERGKNNRVSSADIITKANEVHNNKYEYILDRHKGVSAKLKIICPVHGLFLQKGTNHIYMKQGCPKCADYGVYTGHYFKERPEMKNVDALLYIMSFTKGKEQFFKIGITRRSVEQRFHTTNGYKYDCLHQWQGTLFDVFTIEQKMLQEWRAFKYKPQNKIGGDSECLNLSPSDFDKLISQIREEI